jgi:crotonobetainyl-CoA:carnitine CoA-transferase CaiB-like acyl-CoA transferase
MIQAADTGGVDAGARPPDGALSGLTVIDLSRILAGPYCTQMLGDHGARVIKVESPSGDDTRTWGPPFVEPDTSAYYAGLNRSKENICLDLSRPCDRELLLDLLETADVLVENFKVGTMERWGLGYEDHLANRFPRLIYARITGYGSDGPDGGRLGYDAVVQASSGLMSVNGEPEHESTRIGVPVVDTFTGMLAFGGILLALHERTRSGRGQLVDATLLDAAISLLHPYSAIWLANGTVPARQGSAHPTIAPYETFPTRVGSLFVAATNNTQFAVLAEVLAVPELVIDPRFSSNPARVMNRAALRAALRDPLLRHDAASLTETLRRRGVAASPVNGLATALSDPQVAHRKLVIEHDNRKYVGVPIKLSRTPGYSRGAPARKGENTNEVIGALIRAAE